MKIKILQNVCCLGQHNYCTVIGDSYLGTITVKKYSLYAKYSDYGNLGSNRVLRWRFLGLLVQQDQKMLCRDLFFGLSSPTIFLLAKLGRRSSSGLKSTDSILVAILLLFTCDLSSSQI